jgi:glycosyltransferase involved in cell wall biosynthesis
LKIGIVTHRYIPAVGGAEAYLHDLHRLLQSAGHSVNVYQADSGQRSPGVHNLPNLPGPIPKLVSFNMSLATAIPRLSREDLLLVSYPEHYPPIFWHPRVIVISHGSTWTHEKRNLRKNLRMLSAKWACKKARGYVFNDIFTMCELGIDIPSRGSAFCQVQHGKWYIPNCVDTTVFRKRQVIQEISGMNPILVPRNLTYPRGIDLAIKAFARLLAEKPELHLLIVGSALTDMKDSVEYEKELRHMVDHLKLNGKVSFAGRFGRDKMPAVYSSALLTLIPSRASEGTSLAALESMACGTPVVTTDVEGLKDIPGLKCFPCVDGIHRGLETALERRDELGKVQQREVKEGFNEKLWEKGWLEVIREAAC